MSTFWWQYWLNYPIYSSLQPGRRDINNSQKFVRSQIQKESKKKMDREVANNKSMWHWWRVLCGQCLQAKRWPLAKSCFCSLMAYFEQRWLWNYLENGEEKECDASGFFYWLNDELFLLSASLFKLRKFVSRYHSAKGKQNIILCISSFPISASLKFSNTLTFSLRPPLGWWAWNVLDVVHRCVCKARKKKKGLSV